jgi:D-alanyl-D-alanine carboxypeptidase
MVYTIVEQQLAVQNLPGAVVLISIPGEGEMVKAYGQANLQTHAPRSATAPFRIASITKTFIGTLILQLADEGLLALTDPVSKWYPSFPNGDAITIDHLLRMRSGIADSLDDSFLNELYANPTAPLTQQDMIDRSAARAAEFVPPDTVTRYTNVNFVLLDEIAAKVSGKDIRTLLRERIYGPLGMTQTVYPQATELGGSNHGYLFNPGSGQFEDLTVLDPSGAGGAGALISTLADLTPSARALCTGTLLKPATQALRLQGSTLDGEPAFVQYGRGLLHLGNFCGHNGTVFGFSSEMFYLPEKDAVIVVNVNRLDLDDHSRSTELFLLLTKLLFPEDVSW